MAPSEERLGGFAKDKHFAVLGPYEFLTHRAIEKGTGVDTS